jgi:hypothetical protein
MQPERRAAAVASRLADWPGDTPATCLVGDLPPADSRNRPGVKNASPALAPEAAAASHYPEPTPWP